MRRGKVVKSRGNGEKEIRGSDQKLEKINKEK